MKKMICALFMLFFIVVAAMPILHAEEWDTASFDGGSGSTLNEGSMDYSGSGVPDVGPSGPVGVATDEAGNNYSY